jgi:hypothetical protein
LIGKIDGVIIGFTRLATISAECTSYLGDGPIGVFQMLVVLYGTIFSMEVILIEGVGTMVG